MKNQTRIDRLRRLRAVVELHKGQRGKPVKINGVERGWNMHIWSCGTSACALGCYALTPYGKRHLSLVFGVPTDLETGMEAEGAGAYHFGLSRNEALWLFIPDEYGDQYEDEETQVPPSKVIAHIDKIIRKYERGEGDMQETEAT